MTNFKDIKYYFEDMFNTGWTDTPIHFGGQEFDAPSTFAEWINLVYTPQRSERGSISDNLSIIYGTVYISCWAEDDVDVMGLTDDVIAFVEEALASPHKILKTTIIDHGWNTANKSYTIIALNIQSTLNECDLDCTHSIGGMNGLLWQENELMVDACSLCLG